MKLVCQSNSENKYSNSSSAKLRPNEQNSKDFLCLKMMRIQDEQALLRKKFCFQIISS